MKYFVTKDEVLTLDPESRLALRGDFATLTDGVTHYELRGPENGQLAVLVPGLTIPLFYWDKVVPLLHDRGIRTLAFSAYGRGFSDRATGKYDEAMFVRQLRELVAHLEIDELLNLVGTSMGALGAMSFAVESPVMVRALTLIGPAGLSTDTALQQKALRLDPVAKGIALKRGRDILLGHLGHNVSDPELVAPLTEMISDCYRYEGSMYSFFSTLQNYPLSGRGGLYAKAGKLGVPISLGWGTEDQVTPISGLDEARRLLQPVAVEVIEDCGHMAPYERPEQSATFIANSIHAQQDRKSS